MCIILTRPTPASPVGTHREQRTHTHTPAPAACERGAVPFPITKGRTAMGALYPHARRFCPRRHRRRRRRADPRRRRQCGAPSASPCGCCHRRIRRRADHRSRANRTRRRCANRSVVSRISRSHSRHDESSQRENRRGQIGSCACGCRPSSDGEGTRRIPCAKFTWPRT